MRSLPPVLVGLCALASVAAAAEPVVSEEVPVGFLPVEWVSAAMQKALSPPARYIWTSPSGPLRITGEGAKIDAARKALEEMQKAPALVPVELSFSTITRRTVQQLPAQQPVADYGFPVPNRYDPPRIIQQPGGGFTVIPAQPRDFRTRSVGPGAVVNPSPTGYQTLTPEVRMSETTTVQNGVARRFTASTVPGKAVIFPAVNQAADPAALHALALKYRAISENEPAWPAAGTELQVTPRLSEGSLVVNIVPQIVLPPAAAGASPRRISLAACSAGVLIVRGAPANTGRLPRTDPEFYRVFLGAAQTPDDAVAALTVTANVQYIGAPPK